MVHHHYQHPDSAAGLASLRVVASQPTRVEMYDADDRLVLVDDNGNGDFSDQGDSLLQDTDGDGQPDFSLRDGESALRLHVHPAAGIPASGITLSIERWDGKEWVQVAEDRILP